MARSPEPESMAENFWMETPSLNMVPDAAGAEDGDAVAGDVRGDDLDAGAVEAGAAAGAGDVDPARAGGDAAAGAGGVVDVDEDASGVGAGGAALAGEGDVPRALSSEAPLRVTPA